MTRPKGFALLAIVLALLLPAQVIALLARHPAGGADVERLLELLVAALTAISAEALWRVRPWATRACGVLAALAMLLLALRFDGAGTPVVVMTRLANVMLVGVVLVFAVVCIRHTLEHVGDGTVPRHGGTRISLPPRRGR